MTEATTQNLSSEVSILDAIRECEEAARIAAIAKENVATQLSTVLGKVIYPGLVIDLSSRKGLPEYFTNVRTMRGNDRGTKLFRVESFPDIDVMPQMVSGSCWTCEATPISEKTGKDMNGAAHGPDSNRNTVALRGDLLVDFPTDHQGAEYLLFRLKRLMEFVAATSATSLKA